ncbi:hypothetical protein [Streptomyces roseus]|uniref:hypothetical protein n=1 Tax=Streptomyces roseus TaxID=66430 RepID=UPI000AD3F8E4|nr:hypothetical protein [Streptomyces roseus]
MGIKDQFQDKAQELEDKAKASRQGAKDEAAPAHAAHGADQAKKKKAKVHDELDDNWDF